MEYISDHIWVVEFLKRNIIKKMGKNLLRQVLILIFLFDLVTAMIGMAFLVTVLVRISKCVHPQAFNTYFLVQSVSKDRVK